MKEQSTLAELAKKYEVSLTMHWKAELVNNAGTAFGKLEMMLDLPSVSFGVAQHNQSKLCFCIR